MKRTPWFPVSVKPVRVGWYETSIGSWEVSRKFFDGLVWRHGRDQPPAFYWSELGESKWCGLTEPAK